MLVKQRHQSIQPQPRRSAPALILTAAVLTSVVALPMMTFAQDKDLIPLPHELPQPSFAGTPAEVPAGSNAELPKGKRRPIPLVPKGTTNLALKKKPTSARPPFMGSLDLVTDGNKEPENGRTVELRAKTEWLQLDLGASSKLFYILFWHWHMEPVVFRDVVVQISNDPEFKNGVTTLFNNDVDNSSGLGIGKDREYFEMEEGKLVDAKGTTARYVRLYSNGSTYRDPLNRYTEVEVYGLPPN
jgi:hypothetical protein